MHFIDPQVNVQYIMYSIMMILQDHVKWIITYSD